VPAVLPVTVCRAPWEASNGTACDDISGFACLDSGTKCSAIDIEVMEALAISPMGTTAMKGVASKQAADVPIFAATLMFPGTNVPDLVLADLIGMHLEWGGIPEIAKEPIIVLLGRSFLMRYTVVIDGPTMSVTLFHRT
jgi:hypothetical protein